jgi:hypothetical protein
VVFAGWVTWERAPPSLNLLGWIAGGRPRPPVTEKYKTFRGCPLPGQCGANSAEPSFAGGAGAGAGGGGGGAEGSGAGGGSGSGAGGGVGTGAGLGAGRWRRGLEAIFVCGRGSRRGRPRRGWRWVWRRRVRASPAGLARLTGRRSAPTGLGAGSAPRRIATRGSPTSAANGGASGAFNNPGSTCSATSPPTSASTTFPALPQRIRTPRIFRQGQSPDDPSPGARTKQPQTSRAACREEWGAPPNGLYFFAAEGPGGQPR